MQIFEDYIESLKTVQHRQYNLPFLFNNDSHFNNKKQYLKSPLNYIGGKHKILNQIIPLFPKNIKCFVDLFAGGCNVGINVRAEKIIFNDNLTYLITLYKYLQNTEISVTLDYIKSQINSFNLSKDNEAGYKELRQYYNDTKHPLDLMVLVAYSFNHQIRFNNAHEFNNPFGKNRSSYNANIKKNLINFCNFIQENRVEFTSDDFNQFNYNALSHNDFIYCDPPYLISTGTYNDGKRGFNGWGTTDEMNLLNILDSLNKKNIKFALSNVIQHKGQTNIYLKEWIENNKYYTVHELNHHYTNSNYQKINRDQEQTVEILVTNY
jgi:DNA adenine methylase